MCIAGLDIRCRGRSGRMEAPLQEMDVCCCSLATFETRLSYLDIARPIIGCGAWKREDELWMSLGGGVHTLVGSKGDDGAEREGIGGEAQAPDVFEFLLREVFDFGEIEVAGEWFDACA